MPYLKLAGIVLVGWQFARALLVAAEKHAEDKSFYDSKIATAHFFADPTSCPSRRVRGGHRQCKERRRHVGAE